MHKLSDMSSLPAPGELIIRPWYRTISVSAHKDGDGGMTTLVVNLVPKIQRVTLGFEGLLPDVSPCRVKVD